MHFAGSKTDLAWISVLLALIISIVGSSLNAADTIEKLIAPEPNKREVEWMKREGVPLSATERAEIVSLGKLPTADAIRKIGWFIVNCKGPYVTQVARETFLTLPDWEPLVRKRLEELNAVPSPDETFGPELYKKFDWTEAEASTYYNYRSARIGEGQLFTGLRWVNTGTAVRLVAPYLFDERKALNNAGGDYGATEPIAYDTVFALYGMQIEGAPGYDPGKYPDFAMWLGAWRGWWTENATRFGADSNWRPGSGTQATTPLKNPITPSTAGAMEGPKLTGSSVVHRI